MFGTIFRKKYPDFWNKYDNYFKENKETDIENTRFVVFDTESTGLDIKNDRILSIGAISILGNSIDVSHSFEIYLNQEKFNADTVKIHGILKAGNLTKFSEEEAIIQFINYIRDGILVAHHVDFDVAIIDKALSRMNLPKLKNKRIDTGVLYKMSLPYSQTYKHFGLDELCNVYKITKHDRHTASGDAYIAAILFQKIMASLKKKNKNLQLRDLFHSQKREGLL